MGKFKDLTGLRFGRLTVIEDSGERKNKGVAWKCRCDCGNEKLVSSDHLLRGRTKSCGCLLSETSRKKLQKQYKKEPEKGTIIALIKPHKRVSKANKSGVTSVYWYARSQKWNAEIGLKGKIYNLGRFTNKQDAINARKEAEAKYFKPILEKYGKEAESDGTTSHSRMDHPSTSATPDNL